MSPVERRPHERAMHETYLVIRAVPTDMGSRPLSGPFASPDVTVGADGRPRAVVWNLGTREVQGVVTEFASVPAGQPITAATRKVIGMGNPANIPANSCVTVTCNSIWPRMTSADVLLVTAFHPELDPVKSAYDPLNDRHCGQMNYPWAGRFEGKAAGPGGMKLAVEIRPANQGLFRVRLFQQVNNRLPTNPQIDRTMAPTGVVFRWQQSYPGRKEDWELTMLDNQRMAIRCRDRMADANARSDQELTGIVARV